MGEIPATRHICSIFELCIILFKDGRHPRSNNHRPPGDAERGAEAPGCPGLLLGRGLPWSGLRDAGPEVRPAR